MRGLAFDGRCKTFDARADGFARGEGIGSALVRKDLGDNLVGLSGVAINHDGRAATITAPNGTAQQRVLRMALAVCGTQAEDVTCIESWLSCGWLLSFFCFSVSMGLEY